MEKNTKMTVVMVEDINSKHRILHVVIRRKELERTKNQSYELSRFKILSKKVVL